nr:MAG: hypothetical protein H1BulkLitter61294_000002 [Mitovirus sp.]
MRWDDGFELLPTGGDLIKSKLLIGASPWKLEMVGEVPGMPSRT